jgi:glycosyltransferase involved in cell wall biosynthesis
MTSSQTPLRVRTPRGYWLPFVVELGQRDTTFVRRPWTPQARLLGEWAGAFALALDPGYDAIHSLNAVPILTRRPYVLTFEDHLPRVGSDVPIPALPAWLCRLLARPRCVAIVAMSEYAIRQFRAQNRGARDLPALEAKLELLRPAVAVVADRPKPPPSDALRLLFVGKDYFRKGGPALLRAHERLRAQRIPVQTTVVSSMRWAADDYVGPPSAVYVEQERARLAHAGVVHHAGLPNADVRALIRAADFLVLPTLHDTFGFVSLEALAAGTPVIATDTCAQPEIVEHGHSGFLLPLERDEEVGKWPWLERRSEPEYQGAYEAAIEGLAAALTQQLASAWESRDGYSAMSQGALDRVRERFDRDVARHRLEALYDCMRPAAAAR